MSRYGNLIANVSNWWVCLLYKWGIRRPDVLALRTRNGVEVRVPKRLLHTFKEVFFDNAYTADLPDGGRWLRRPMVVDVGANVGYFSLYALQRWPGAKVLSFEPMPVNFKLLDEHRRLNEDHDLTVLNQAIFGEPARSNWVTTLRTSLRSRHRSPPPTAAPTGSTSMP
ncbi:MAG: FkbM family methyltransferase [Phycisphaeraceae bacterium]|nr:FkbM family methyltransferase [Phycisphaeraceae bacterium]